MASSSTTSNPNIEATLHVSASGYTISAYVTYEHIGGGGPYTYADSEFPAPVMSLGSGTTYSDTAFANEVHSGVTLGSHDTTTFSRTVATPGEKTITWTAGSGLRNDFEVTLDKTITIAAAPTGAYISSTIPGTHSVTMTGGVESMGTAGASPAVELILLNVPFTTSGLPQRLEAFTTLSATKTIDNNSAALYGGITISPNTQYYKGVYASNGAADLRWDGGTVVTLAEAATVSVDSKTADTVTIAYETTADGGALTKNIEYSLDGGTTWVSGATVATGAVTSGTVTITGLTPNTTYTIHTRTTTTSGSSGGSILTVTTDPPIVNSALYGSVSGLSKKITKLYGGLNTIHNVELKGDTKQTTYTGKNLWNNSQVTSLTYVSPTDTGFKLSKIGSDRITPEYAISLSANTRYTISCEMTRTTTSAYLFCQWITTGGSTIWTPNILNGTTAITPSDDIKGVKFYLQSNEAEGAYVEVNNLQIELGSTATSYEPYVGGLPSPSPDYPEPISVVTGEQTITVTGKNLIDVKSLTFKEKGNVSSYTLADGELTITPSSASSTMYVGFYLSQAIPAQQITLSGNSFGSTIVLRNSANTNVANFGNTNSTRTLSDTAAIIYFNFGATGSTTPFTVNLNTLQLEKGSTTTAYEPYRGHSYTISLGAMELCKIGTAQDYIWKDGADWKIHKEWGKAVYNGTEPSWIKGSTGTAQNVYIVEQPDAQKPLVIAGRCDYFTWTSNVYTDGTVGFVISPKSKNVQAVRFGLGTTTSFDSLPKWTTWLSTHNVTVYYALNTATDTQITDAGLIAQLDALEGAIAPSKTPVVTVTGTLPAIVALDVDGMSKEIVKLYGSVNGEAKIIYEA